MGEYVGQRDLPEHFKENAIVIYRRPIAYAWRYKEATELYEWLRLNGYIIDTVQVFSYITAKIKPITFWRYHGDRNKSKKENIEGNIFEACRFMENVQSSSSRNFVYSIFFESEKKMDAITREYFYKSIIAGGYNYDLEDALGLIERCRILRKEIIGIEVFEISDTSIQPIDIRSYSYSGYEELDPSEYYKRFHIKKNGDTGHWEKAKQFIKDSARSGVYFQISFEK